MPRECRHRYWKQKVTYVAQVCANAYYLKTGLNRKADMHRMCCKHCSKGGQGVQALQAALPETHIIDLADLEEEDETLEDLLLKLAGNFLILCHKCVGVFFQDYNCSGPAGRARDTHHQHR